MISQNIMPYFNIVVNFQAWIKRLKEQVVCINGRNMPATDGSLQDDIERALTRAYIPGMPQWMFRHGGRDGLPAVQIDTNIPELLQHNLNTWTPGTGITPEMRGVIGH